MRATRAVTRQISASFARAVVAAPSETPIDVDRARRQHAAYVGALRAAGVQVDVLPPLDAFPDACFVEDCAVVAAGVAVITRIGTPSRAGEEISVANHLARSLAVEGIDPAATLDGGDCLRVGATVFAGRSARTNALGIRGLARALEPRGLRVVEVSPGPWLHLKCVCSPLGDDRILLAEGAVPASVFGEVEIVSIPRREAYAANALAVNATALVAAGFPETRRIVAERGFDVVPLDTTEIRKADGALTCLSIVW